MENQSGRAYGEASTLIPRERVCSESPSPHAEDGGLGKGSRCGCPRRILRTVTAVGAEADVSPIGGAVRQGDEGKGREIRDLEDPHTV